MAIVEALEKRDARAAVGCLNLISTMSSQFWPEPARQRPGHRAAAGDVTLMPPPHTDDHGFTAPAALAYARDLKGYARDLPHARWPGAHVSPLQFVPDYEEGGETNVTVTPTSETFLSELVTAQATKTAT